ncbi:CBS domain-containing protein [Pseudomaricurvus alcaniphilus]|uniref:CBS domain-containing protein n=1 Tax=Pseudomaricurvus alcaniphilus TaxID=1166482 RepID=UPI00140D70B5|nr:CBS domain-containing protein [Pseudomaricurvus alcaniphilus]NHN38172.1 CBS domain-containing protein [Pseudomaricurvus alcaniphilus]
METIKVSDCMSHQFVSFSPQLPVLEAATKLVKNELLGGPVVDEGGHLVGWISEQDCIGVVSQVIYYSERVAMVNDVMVTKVDSVRPGASALDLANDMKNHKRKIYPVVDDDNKVIGVVSRRNILRRMCHLVNHPELAE